MFLRKLSCYALSALVLVGGFVTGVNAEEAAASGKVYTIKFNHVVDPNTPKGMAAEFFKQRAVRWSSKSGHIAKQLFSEAAVSRTLWG